MERRPDPVGEIVGDEPVDGLALGQHRPALGRGDVGGNLVELLDGAVVQAVAAEMVAAAEVAVS